MKLYYIAAFIVLLTLLQSCIYNRHSTYIVTYYKYKEKTFNEATTGLCTDSLFKSSRKLFQYYDEDSSLLYRLDIIVDLDTTILFNGETILKKDNKTIIINNIAVDIHKYYYDITGHDDEEAYVFINYLYGIVCINYFPWGLSIFPEGENIPVDIKNALLKPENESFYEW
jgi:hypothetical protein